jgi:hypothetical protein
MSAVAVDFRCATYARTTAGRYSSVRVLDGVGRFLISQVKGKMKRMEEAEV